MTETAKTLKRKLPQIKIKMSKNNNLNEDNNEVNDIKPNFSINEGEIILDICDDTCSKGRNKSKPNLPSEKKKNKNRVCLVCNGSSNLNSFNDEHSYLGVVENYKMMLERCFNIKFNIPKNDYIDAICIMCAGRLRQCFEFKKEVELAYKRCNLYKKQHKNALKRTVTNTTIKSNDYVSPRLHLLKNLKQEFYDAKDKILPNAKSKIILDQIKTEDISDIYNTHDDHKSLDEDSNDFDISFTPASDSEWSVTSKEMDRATGRPKFEKRQKILIHELDESSTTCPICSLEMFDWAELSTHYQRHYPASLCHICGFRSVSKNISSHLESHTTVKFYSCKICDRKFKVKNSLFHHVKSFHNNQLLHKCQICNQRFRGSRTKRNHMMKEHGTKFNLKECDFCDKAFLSHYLLTKHIQAVHLKKKNVFCNICGRGFFRDSELKNHLISHSGVRDQECEYCGKCFGRKKTLKEHLKIHLNIKKFKCDLCDKAFVQKCALKGHLKTHGM